MVFHPYLNFGGNCREAMTRYQEILGGQLDILSMRDMPGEADVPAEQADLVMHAALTIGDSMLMASDDPGGSFKGVEGMWVNHTVADAGEAKRIFDALAEGGEATMPFEATFWSPGFGMCVDRFGTPWMVNTAAAES